MTNKERLKEIEEMVLVDKVYYKYLDGTKGHWGKVYTLSEGDYNYLKEQAERVQELESELNKQIEIGYKFEGEVYDLEKENKRYREALEFYANEKSWMNREVTILMDGEPTDVEDCPAIFDDGGNIARRALEGGGRK